MFTCHELSQLYWNRTFHLSLCTCWMWYHVRSKLCSLPLRKQPLVCRVQKPALTSGGASPKCTASLELSASSIISANILKEVWLHSCCANASNLFAYENCKEMFCPELHCLRLQQEKRCMLRYGHRVVADNHKALSKPRSLAFPAESSISADRKSSSSKLYFYSFNVQDASLNSVAVASLSSRISSISTSEEHVWRYLR